MNKRRKKRQQETFTEAEVRALIEHWDSKLDLILEMIAAARKKIEKRREEIQAGREEFNPKFESNFRNLTKRKPNRS